MQKVSAWLLQHAGPLCHGAKRSESVRAFTRAASKQDAARFLYGRARFLSASKVGLLSDIRIYFLVFPGQQHVKRACVRRRV